MLGLPILGFLSEPFSFLTETPAAFPDAVKEKEAPAPGEDAQLGSSIPHTDSGIGEEQVASILNGAELEPGPGPGPDAMSELLSTLSSEVKKSQESLAEPPSELLKPAPSISSISQTKGINVKEILKSLVATPVDVAECGPDPVPYPDPALKREAQAILPMQFHSFDRWVHGWLSGARAWGGGLNLRIKNIQESRKHYINVDACCKGHVSEANLVNLTAWRSKNRSQKGFSVGYGAYQVTLETGQLRFQ